jgi:hypothetical protein
LGLFALYAVLQLERCRIRPQLHQHPPVHGALGSTADLEGSALHTSQVTRVTGVVTPGDKGCVTACQGEQSGSWSAERGGDVARMGWRVDGAAIATPLQFRSKSLPSAGILQSYADGAGVSAGVGEGVWAGDEGTREQQPNLVGGKVGEEGAVGGGEKPKSSYRGQVRTWNVWLTPFLLGSSQGRVLRSASTARPCISRLTVQLDLAETSYGYGKGEKEDRRVNVVVKVPQGVAVLLAGCGTGQGLLGDTGSSGNGGMGSGVTSAAAASGVTAECWPGVALVAVHEFPSCFTWERRMKSQKRRSESEETYKAALKCLGGCMRKFIGWRLYAYEVVSAKGTRRGRREGRGLGRGANDVNGAST